MPRNPRMNLAVQQRRCACCCPAGYAHRCLRDDITSHSISVRTEVNGVANASQFWALPLSDGSFGCGRVIQLAPAEMMGARVSFLGAVWIGPHRCRLHRGPSLA